MKTRRLVALLALLGSALSASTVLAQPVAPPTDDPEPGEDTEAQPEPEPPPPPPPPPEPEPPPPPPPPPPEPEEKPVTKDHDLWVGHLGVSWFGVSNVPIATGNPAGTEDDPQIVPGPPTFVQAPAIGVRYWFTDTVGLDVGLGANVTTGSVHTTTSSADKATVTAFLLHLGAPLSLVEGQHISLQIGPEVNFGYATSTVKPAAQPDPPPAADLSGFRIDVGARVGAEVYFGFIDLPELALEGSVGLFATHQSTSASVGEARASQDNFLVATGEYNSPWDFFTQHLRARYYF
jgi:hypothetical protein